MIDKFKYFIDSQSFICKVSKATSNINQFETLLANIQAQDVTIANLI